MRKLAYWIDEYSPSESVDLMRTLARMHALRGGEIGREILSYIDRADMRSLCAFTFHYEDPRFQTVAQVAHCRQAVAFFSKLEHLEIGEDKRENALRKWWEAEELCRETNMLFRMRAAGDFQFTSRVEAVIHAARLKIARVLGSKPPGVGDLSYRFGPGATTATRKREASLRQKLQANLQCSDDLLGIVKTVLSEMPGLLVTHSLVDRVDEDGEHWSTVQIEVVDGRLDFAAKNATVYRITVVEPPINGLVQLAIGDLLFSNCAAFGLNLRDQSINQALACLGSLTGELATLDLKSASDTNATELVFALLDLDWAILLSQARTRRITLPSGDVVRQEKFSSMGNGFTFPLESLIFWALVSAACPKDAIVNVFGDDIICPRDSVPLVVEVLTAVGFMVNKEKSFASGPFRESCGRDFYRGIDVRPFYQKDWVSPRTLFVLHNWYVRKDDMEMADLVLNWIHPSLRIFGPDGYGDGHLLRPFEKRVKPGHRARGFAGYLFNTFSLAARRDTRPNQPGDYVLPQYSIYRRAEVPLFNYGDAILRVCRTAGADKKTLSLGKGTSPDRRKLVLTEPSLGIPNVSDDDGDRKAVTLPGDDGYKMISIYTLGT